MTPPPRGIRQRESHHRFGRAPLNLAGIAGEALRLLNRLDARRAALLLTLPLFWASYPGLLFGLLGLDPAADATLNSAHSWWLVGILGVHLGFCHWLSMRLTQLWTLIRRRH